MSNIITILLNSEIAKPDAPIFANGKFIDGKMGEHAYCKSKCSTKECMKERTEREHTCVNGLSFYPYKIGDTWITIHGVLGEKANHSDRNLKKISKGRNYNKITADKWINEIKKIHNQIEQQVDTSKSEVLHHFHDPVKWAQQIFISAEKIIDRGTGQSFGEKLENSTSEIKSLFKASSMLVDSFKLTGIYFNPESAKYGETLNCEIYKLFDKIQSIIFHSEGKKYNKRFKLKGGSFRRISVYESFQIIPLCLIQNAVKYSKTSEIEINIHDTNFGIEVSIVSQGPYISDIEKVEIFKKGVRGKYADRLHHEGLGIGLYVAQKTAEAHGFEIKVASTPENYERDGIPMATNNFFFFISATGVK